MNLKPRDSSLLSSDSAANPSVGFSLFPCQPPGHRRRNSAHRIRQPIHGAHRSARAEGLMKFIEKPKSGNQQRHQPKIPVPETPGPQRQEEPEHAKGAGMHHLVDGRLDMNLGTGLSRFPTQENDPSKGCKSISPRLIFFPHGWQRCNHAANTPLQANSLSGPWRCARSWIPRICG
jgi:hypothetical protein